MKSSLEIAQSATLKPIAEIAAGLDIQPNEYELYGNDKAKLTWDLWERIHTQPDGRLILVTATSPTRYGEGKTTTTIGLGQSLVKLGQRAVVCVREPSLGPVFGIKGGATGGGYAQVLPMEAINLHFTGDLHAITAAHNLLSAMIDNHLYFSNPLKIAEVTWPRVMDMNDRALRSVTVRGGKHPRDDRFDITVASEVMAVLCLARDYVDLQARLAALVIGRTRKGEPVTASQLKADGAMAVLLKDAFKPNLVQTLEGTPALVHGGPFANIAHGCNSAIATRMALKLGDWVVTEAGFGSDLGAEKFLDIKCRVADLRPALAVLVTTLRGSLAQDSDSGNLEPGIANVAKHVENMRSYGLPVVIAVNKFNSDHPAVFETFLSRLRELGVPVEISTVFADGSAGGVALAQTCLSAAVQGGVTLRRPYELNQTLREKIEAVATRIYGASGVRYTSEAEARLAQFEAWGYSHLPVCMAKTQYSFSDNPELLGRPSGFEITITGARLSAGAGFVVALCGDIMTMPGLPKIPAAERITLTEDGHIAGLS